MNNPVERPQRGSLFLMFLFLGTFLSPWAGPGFASENVHEYFKTNPMIRFSQANDAVQPPGRKPTDRETSNLQTFEIISSLKDRPPEFTKLISEKTAISLFGKEYQRFWTGFELTQTILTPDHPDEEGPKMRERPPAGLLLYGFSANGVTLDKKQSRKIGIWGGIIGSLSGAGQLQNWVHVNLLKGSEEALCWKNEMGNTPVIIAGIEQSQKLREYHPSSNDGVSFNVITREGLYLGSSTSAASVIEFQLGWNPERHNQYGVTRIGPQYTTDISLDPIGIGKPLTSSFVQSLFLFSSIRMDFVVHDQTLTVRTITPRPIVFKGSYGVGIVLHLWGYPISVTLVAATESKRYDEQKADHGLVTLSVSGFLPPLADRNKKAREFQTHSY